MGNAAWERGFPVNGCFELPVVGEDKKVPIGCKSTVPFWTPSSGSTVTATKHQLDKTEWHNKSALSYAAILQRFYPSALLVTGSGAEAQHAEVNMWQDIGYNGFDNTAITFWYYVPSGNSGSVKFTTAFDGYLTTDTLSTTDAWTKLSVSVTCWYLSYVKIYPSSDGTSTDKVYVTGMYTTGRHKVLGHPMPVSSVIDIRNKIIAMGTSSRIFLDELTLTSANGGQYSTDQIRKAIPDAYMSFARGRAAIVPDRTWAEIGAIM